MSARIDLTGQRFGAWTVVCFVENERPPKWVCVCDCGTKRTVVGQSLREGRTTSCGCQKSQKISKFRMKHGHSVSKKQFDADKKTRETLTYTRWKSMHSRVRSNHPSVSKYYKAKGIMVVERWNKFQNFFADMGECPPGLTLDRIDPNKNYEPGNCRWATFATQVRARTMLELCPSCGKLRRCQADEVAGGT